MEDIILKCERIEKKYSKTKALDNINLSTDWREWCWKNNSHENYIGTYWI